MSKTMKQGSDRPIRKIREVHADLNSHDITEPTPCEKIEASHGQPKRIRLTRDGDRDLAFRGWRIGEGEHGTGGNSGYAHDWTRGIEVRIYLTTGGNLVAHARRWSRYQGEGEPSSCSPICREPGELLAWLVSDNAGGYLGPASKEAWEQACSAVDTLDGQDVEEVE